MAKKHDHRDDNLMAVEDALSKSEQFIEKNQRLITIVIGAVVVLILAYLGYQRYFLLPKSNEAQEQMFMAEYYFGIDSLNLALIGDGNYPGFYDIVDAVFSHEILETDPAHKHWFYFYYIYYVCQTA